jgi:hypothetical protein
MLAAAYARKMVAVKPELNSSLISIIVYSAFVTVFAI